MEDTAVECERFLVGVLGEAAVAALTQAMLGRQVRSGAAGLAPRGDQETGTSFMVRRGRLPIPASCSSTRRMRSFPADRSQRTSSSVSTWSFPWSAPTLRP